MAVLPPVNIGCVEVENVLTTPDALVEQTLPSPTTGDCSSTPNFDPCLALVLALGTVTSSVPLSWILYNSPLTPSYYNLYRKYLNVETRFSLIQTNIQDNLYTDVPDAFASTSTFDYYVRPVYPGGYEGEPSNTVRATVPLTGWMYGFSGTQIHIIDARNPANPLYIGAVSSSPVDPGQTYMCFADENYLYFWPASINARGCYVFSIADRVNPVYLSQIGSSLGGNLIIRRNLATYNNLAFGVSGDWHKVRSYNISNMASPTLISEVTPSFDNFNDAQYEGARVLAFDQVLGRLFLGGIKSFGGASYQYVNVASDGTLSVGTATELHPAVNAFTGGLVVTFQSVRYYWMGYFQAGAYPGQGLFTETPLGKSNPSLEAFYNGTIRPVKHDGSYFIWGHAANKAGDKPIYIFSPNPAGGAIQEGNIGTVEHWTSQICKMGNNVYWQDTTDKKLYIHSITNPASPTLVGSVQIGGGAGTIVTGLALSGDTGWVGNNGLCSV